MTRKGILLTLLAMAVGLLVLGAIRTPEARAATTWGNFYFYDEPTAGDTAVVYCKKSDWLSPRSCPIYFGGTPPQWTQYYFYDLGVGVYDVWVVYTPMVGGGTCTSQKYPVEITDDDQVEQQDIYIYPEDCP